MGDFHVKGYPSDELIHIFVKHLLYLSLHPRNLI